MKGVIRFDRQSKLIPTCIEPFKVIRRVGEVGYVFALPLTSFAIYPVFHVFMLYRDIPNESHIIQYDFVELDDHLNFGNEPVANLARDVH